MKQSSILNPVAIDRAIPSVNDIAAGGDQSLSHEKQVNFRESQKDLNNSQMQRSYGGEHRQSNHSFNASGSNGFNGHHP